MTIYLLDMGLKPYGDCIVLIHGNKKILIDHGKPGDQSLIRLQLKKIFKHEPPFVFDLLVLTHCHNDHIGSLPEVIESGEISAGKYLLADPAFRWGKEDGSDTAVMRDGITEALLEEDHSSLSDDELEAFLSDMEELVVRYRRMISTLITNGADVRLFRGIDEGDYSDLHDEFSGFGFEILGPTKKHLKITHEALLGARDSISDFITNSADVDSVTSTVDLYRKIFRDGTIDNEAFLDAAKNSGSINDQSIVIKVSEDGFAALLTGDMQFSKPNVTGIESEMAKLISKVFDKGPYDLIKTSHHSSDNGLSAEMLDRWIAQGTEFFAHTGGLKDNHHPDEDVLALLKDRNSQIKFARTDRNGMIKAKKDEDGILTVYIAKGRFNNFTPNIVPDESITEAQESGPVTPVLSTSVPAIKKEEPIIPWTQISQSGSVNNIELSAKIPTDLTKVTITVEIDSEKKKSLIPNKIRSYDRLGSGRFDNLLFVTNSSKLISNIGISETQKVLNLIQQIPHTRLLDLPVTDTAIETANLVKDQILANTKGIVILGGYDVIPAAQVNVLSDALRNKIETEGQGEDTESDDFIVWSDDIYGDTDNDLLPELPVSRIPDGKSGELLFNALQAPAFSLQNRYGIRNLKRPFAIDVFDKIPYKTKSQFEISEKCSPKLVTGQEAIGAVYFMLHGYYNDATRFAGEKEQMGTFEAFDIHNVPKSSPGTVVFAGCCYGALIALPKADRKEPDIAIRSRTAEQSIALAFLNSSANAFIGCTGAHYSPKKQEDNFFGKPMHISFWSNIMNGKSPAEALFAAKMEYASKMPHGLSRALSQGIEIKTLHQFTCLGIGW